MSEFIEISCNCPSHDVAHSMGQRLVEERLAACVSVHAGAQSIYQWQGKTEHETEYQLQIKTRKTLFTAVERQLLALHPYDVPQIIAFDIITGHQPYLDWIRENTQAL